MSPLAMRKFLPMFYLFKMRVIVQQNFKTSLHAINSLKQNLKPFSHYAKKKQNYLKDLVHKMVLHLKFLKLNFCVTRLTVFYDPISKKRFIALKRSALC